MPETHDNPANKIGLILSGGGARAAYQVGVLRAIANILPRETRNPFNVITGTSAGALNAVSLATHAQRLRTGVRTLEYVWSNISSDQVYRLDSAGIFSSASNWAMAMLSNRATESPVSLLNNSPLKELLSKIIKLERIQHYIDTGLLDAVSVTASGYSNGESISFYQAVKGIEDWTGPHRKGIRSKLTLEHLMASSAIPTIFPAVKISNQYFGDGAIRQLAPTSTALHLGARKILAIGVSANKNDQDSPGQEMADKHPSLSQIVGHILNSAFVDTLENDLEFLRHMNDVLPYVSERKLLKQNIRHRVVDLLEISPSRDLSDIASEHFDELPKALKLFIREASSGTMLSLLLFEPGYCNELMRLGNKDAMAMENQIRAFFRLD
ncbi:MAG: patatin-like phospholipase family protein [Gammaproteobacteria bacterium]|nr:patatin-like phospholipase family protein [Gammaproteobacteria bacterium]